MTKLVKGVILLAIFGATMAWAASCKNCICSTNRDGTKSCVCESCGPDPTK